MYSRAAASVEVEGYRPKVIRPDSLTKARSSSFDVKIPSFQILAMNCIFDNTEKPKPNLAAGCIQAASQQPPTKTHAAEDCFFTETAVMGSFLKARIHQMSTDYLLCARHCTKSQRRSHNQKQIMGWRDGFMVLSIHMESHTYL